ncbi:conserved hypothetical protein [Staphylococcus argenteus]|uniref:Uncharacterized protein n=1 Tax=Staphylococcus argenteus TaxID=985002 RepID=A0A7U7PXM7_9STAP|nr:conserved hypothetical protein [Staphylococcus argenteus]CRI21586.1 conserved hypothetical protein [Staphylococcus argenteus]
MLFFSHFTPSLNLIGNLTKFHVTGTTPRDYMYQLFPQYFMLLFKFNNAAITLQFL